MKLFKKIVKWGFFIFIILFVIGFISSLFIDNFEEGSKYFSNGNIQRAERYLKKVKNDDSNYKQAVELLAKINSIKDSLEILKTKAEAEKIRVATEKKKLEEVQKQKKLTELIQTLEEKRNVIRKKLEYWLKKELEIEPQKPVEIKRIDIDTKGNGLIDIYLDVKYDPRKFKNPEKDLELWAMGVLDLLAVISRPSDLRVSIGTWFSEDKLIIWCHSRHWADRDQKTFEKRDGWVLLNK